MKISKILMFSFLLLCFVLPYITIAYAAEKPKYVGVSEGQEIVWNTLFDKDPVEEYFEDLGYTDEETIDNTVDLWFDSLSWDDDVVAWKVIVNDIRKEDDEDFHGSVTSEKDVNFVKVEVGIYETEDKSDASAWDDIDKVEKLKLYEREDQVFISIAYTGCVDQGALGLYFYTSDLIPQPEWPMFFTPKNLKWDDVAGDCDEEIEDRKLDEKYSVGSADVDYFFQKKTVGLEMNEEGSGNIEDFDAVMKYTGEGILYYYEYSYDGEPIAKFELDTIGGVYLIENWWWIALIAGAVIIAVIVIIVVVASKRR